MGEDGMEKASVIFFLQGGVMRFHDLFLMETNGHKVNTFLSSEH